MLPANVDTGRVTGRFIIGVVDGPDPDLEPDAIPASGTVTFTASVPYLPNPTADPEPVTILKTSIIGVLDSEGYLCTPDQADPTQPGYRGVRLVATDDPDLSVQGWTWNVVYNFEAVNGTRPAIQTHAIALPADSTVDLTTVVKVPSSTGIGTEQAEALAASAQQAAVEAAAAAVAASEAAQATDVGVASFIGADTATAAALDRVYRRAVSVREYGAVGDGSTDDTAAIQATITAAEAMPGTVEVFIPAGIYVISDTVTFTTNVNADQATFWYSGTGVAVHVGYQTAKVLTDRDIRLPKVIRRNPPAGTWDGSSVGVKIASLNQCRVHIPRVETFEIGVLITANGAAGTAYCDFYLGTLWINHENLVLDQGHDPVLGWVNQNNFWGGRISHSVNRGISDDPIACHLRIGNRNNFPADNVPDGNSFYGLSMEGVNAGEGGWARYRVFCFGKYNQFFNCRWETRDGGTPVIRSEGLASNNIIHGGYHSWKLQQSGLNAFDIRDGVVGVVDAVNTTGQVLTTGTNTTITGWTNNTLSKVAYDDSTGEFTLAAGRWRVRARVTYAQNTTGTRTTRLYSGSTVVDMAILPAQSTNSALTSVVEATITTNGTQKVRVTAQQTSGGDLALASSAPYVSFRADYLGA